MQRYWQFIASLLGFLAVAAGAAGAHAVNSESAKLLMEKASYFQLIHSLLLLFIAAQHGFIFRIARWFLLAGIVLFCGSLYAKALLDPAYVPLAPAGGICLMLGWLSVMLAATKLGKK